MSEHVDLSGTEIVLFVTDYAVLCINKIINYMYL